MQPKDGKVRRAIRRTAVIGALLVCLVLGLALVVLFGQQTGLAATGLGLALATVPVPIYVLLILWIDRFEAEPHHLLGLTFFLGATVSAFAAAGVNTLIETRFGEDPELLSAIIASGGVVEEIAKGLVLVLLYFWREDEFDGVIDGIVYAGMVGLGFAMLENIQYYGMAAFYGGAELGGRMFILRGLMAPFAHPLFTSLTGLALGMARRTRGRAKRLALGLVGLALASGMHAMWNLSALRGGEAFQATYLFIMVPIFVFGLGVIVVELRREGRMVVLHLQRERDSGLLTAEEHARLGSVMARVSRRWRALRQGGRPSWRAAGRLHQLAGELALHRQRVALGVVEINEETRTIEAAYVVEIEVLIRTLPPRGTGA